MIKIKSKSITGIFFLYLLLTSSNANAVDLVAENILYYNIGGGQALAGAPSYNSTTLTPGSLSLRLSNSCEGFDLEENMKAYFQGLADNTDYAIKGLVYAAQNYVVNNLLLYAIRRANPNLATMLENAMLRYEEFIQIGIKSCETARNEILAGENPFYDYIKIGRKNTWDEESKKAQSGDTSATIAATQAKAQERPSCINWAKGEKKLCPEGGNIELIKDIAKTGYESLRGGAGGGVFGVSDSRLTKVWPSETDATEWITNAFGEFHLKDVYTSTPESKIGRGTLPSMFEEAKLIQDKLIELTSSNVVPVSVANQDLLSVPGLDVSETLLKAIQEISSEQMKVSFIKQISSEFALLKNMEKISLARRLIHAGLFDPNIASTPFAANIVNTHFLPNLENEYDMISDEYELRQKVSQSSSKKLIEYIYARAVEVEENIGAKENKRINSGGIIK